MQFSLTLNLVYVNIKFSPKTLISFLNNHKISLNVRTNFFMRKERKETKMTLFGMPLISFIAFLSWPITFTTIAIIIYFRMAKQDAQTDDSEFVGGGGHH